MATTQLIERIRANEDASEVAAPFLEQPVDIDALYEEIIADLKPRTNPYSPFHVERLLDEVGAHIDRAIRYRDMIYGYQERALNAALDIAAFEASSLSLEALQQSLWTDDQHQAAKTVEYAVLGESPTSPDKSASMSKAESEKEAPATVDVEALTLRRARGMLGLIDAVERGETARRAQVTAYWQGERERRKLLAQRYTTPGNPLNYAEKAAQYVALLKSDLAKIYNKCRAIADGVGLVYGEKVSLPEKPRPSAAGAPLDLLTAYVLWQREQIETITGLRLAETEFEQTIVVRNAKDADSPFYTAAAYNAHLQVAGDRTLELDLRDYFPDTIKRLRVIAAGITVTFDATGNVNDGERDRATFIKAAIVPPPLDTDNRRPLLFDGVGAHSSGLYNRLKSGAQIENIDPKGIWTLKIGKYVFRQEPNSGLVVTPALVKNVQLHLRLRGLCPTPASDIDWTELP